MSTKKTASMLLAASVLMTGFTGAFVYAPNAAFGITSVDELSDVDQSSWAYDALKDLVNKYNVIEGYPDRTFRGEHKATRYEMAAALNALIKHIGKDIARLGTEKADKADLAKLAKLQEEFKAELAALKARTDALEARAAKIEAKNEEQDNRLTILEKLKVYGDVTFGAYADMAGRGGNGTPFGGQGHTIPQANYFPAVQSNTNEGISDGISALGRVRLNVDYPIVEDADGEGKVGEGTIHTRIVGAFGRVSPMLSNNDAARLTDGYGMLSGVSRIASDASLFNEGIRTSSMQNGGGPAIISGTNTRANIYLESAYYTQEFRRGIPLLTQMIPGFDIYPEGEEWDTTLQMKMGLVPWREIFQKSPYTGDETQQFQNTALINNAAIAVNAIAPTVALEWHQGLGKWHSLDYKAAVSALDVSDAMDVLGISYEVGLNYNFGWLADWLDHPGNLYAGGFILHGRGGSNSLVSQTGIATGTFFNGRQFGSNEAFLNALSNNPAGNLSNHWNRPAINQAFGPAVVPAALQPAQLVGLSLGMGLNAATLASQGNLLTFFGMTPAQFRNPDTPIPAATIAAINLNAGLAFPVGTTMGQYIQYMQDRGILAANNVILDNNANLPYGDDPKGVYDDNDNVNGFYVGVNQEIYKGAGGFFSYGVMDTGPLSMITSALQNGTGANAIFNQTAALYGVKEAMNGGIEVPMEALHLPWRKKDVLGVGYAMIKPNDAYGSAYGGVRDVNGWGTVGGSPIYNRNTPWSPSLVGGAGSATQFSNDPVGLFQPYPKQTSEHVIEAYYKVHVNDRFSVTPNIQFIINRLGDPTNDLTTVLGLRSSFSF